VQIAIFNIIGRIIHQQCWVQHDNDVDFKHWHHFTEAIATPLILELCKTNLGFSSFSVRQSWWHPYETLRMASRPNTNCVGVACVVVWTTDRTAERTALSRPSNPKTQRSDLPYPYTPQVPSVCAWSAWRWKVRPRNAPPAAPRNVPRDTINKRPRNVPP